MTAPAIITLTSDFGLRDTFVAQMKGRILSICPAARLVDLTHEVPPQDVVAGSFQLWAACRVFPPGTIHLAVVDPGVGTSRRPLVLATGRYRFVAPDNGLLTRVLEGETALASHVIEARHYMAERVSDTFHGRDVFAPAAAWLARGAAPANFGPPAGELVRLDLPRVAPARGRPVRVRVVAVDRFGNVTLDLPRAAVEPLLPPAGPGVELVAPGGRAATFRRCYEDGAADGAFLLINSADHLEVAIYRGDAARTLSLAVGAEAELRVGE